MQINSLIFLGDLLDRNIIFSSIRGFLALIASILYSMVGVFFEIIFAVANLDNTEMMNGLYASIEKKFYIIVGIFMLFKVMMSLITYFANPDKIADKEMGAGKMITRIVVMLILLVLVPNYLFKTLANVQEPLLNTLGRIVLGSNTALDQSKAHSTGQQMATTILGGFFNTAEGCGDKITVDDNLISEIVNMSAEACGEDKTRYKYDFNFLGAIISIFVILGFILVIGVQVAIRAFKLIILKILAPVPIISYIDPKSMKDGGRTSAYIKLFISTYLDLFIQFGIMFFVVLIIDELLQGSIFSLSLSNVKAGGMLIVDSYGLGIVFVVIGLLLFAFQAPKFIKKALGLKDSEFGAGLSGFLTTGAAMAGAVGSGVAGFAASKAAHPDGGKLNMLRNIGAGISSAISGGRAGYSAAGGKGDFSKVLPAINKKNAEMRARNAANIGMLDIAKAGYESIFKGATQADVTAEKIKNKEDMNKNRQAFSSTLKTAADYISAEVEKGNGGTIGQISANDSHMFANYKEMNTSYLAAKSQGKDKVTFKTFLKKSDGTFLKNADGSLRSYDYTMSLKDVEANIGFNKKMNDEDMARKIKNGEYIDAKAVSLLDNAQAAGEVAGESFDWRASDNPLKDIKSTKDSVDITVTKESNDIAKMKSENTSAIAARDAFYGKNQK